MKWLLLMTAGLALVGSCGLLHLAVLHNPQEEFVAEGGVLQLGHVAFFLAVNFLILWAVASLPVLWFWLHARLVLRRPGG
ncbi:MAG TPA: hypothetical protein VFA75_07895 [Nevskia sp.]|jgi:hypothetical protein|nr:hypothetical protein [Nevskia sp.]